MEDRAVELEVWEVLRFAERPAGVELVADRAA